MASVSCDCKDALSTQLIPVQECRKFTSDPCFAEIRDTIKTTGGSVVQGILESSERNGTEGGMDQAFFGPERFEVGSAPCRVFWCTNCAYPSARRGRQGLRSPGHPVLGDAGADRHPGDRQLQGRGEAAHHHHDSLLPAAQEGGAGEGLLLAVLRRNPRDQRPLGRPVKRMMGVT